MSLNLCNSKDCYFYKKCKQKNDPYKGGFPCPGHEIYINQDISFSKGGQFEISFTDAKVSEQNISSEGPSVFSTTPLDNWFEIMRLFFFDRLKPKEISERLNCSQQRVYVVIRECKEILLNRAKKKSGRKKKKKIS